MSEQEPVERAADGHEPVGQKSDGQGTDGQEPGGHASGGQESGGQESDGRVAPGGSGPAPDAERAAAARKARLVFGDPLDQQSRDDTDSGWGERPGGSSSGRGLDWYLSQRPPHHGG
ncbi:hypothetical protein ACWGB8_03100 [Kitasatospora sp. NPDC054939]